MVSSQLCLSEQEQCLLHTIVYCLDLESLSTLSCSLLPLYALHARMCVLSRLQDRMANGDPFAADPCSMGLPGYRERHYASRFPDVDGE